MITRAIAGLLTIALGCALGHARAQSAPVTRVVVGTEELTGPATWVYDALTFEDGSAVRTNGFPLSITVLGNVYVHGLAEITSFGKAEAPPQPPKPARAPDGRSFDPGPGSEGSGAPGPSGMAGSPGKGGTPGADGRTPAPISLIIVGSFDGGTLRVLNGGGNGGPGGDGGDGGNGGSGGQGQRATSNRVFGGIVVGCASGPGFGGAGGAGGGGGAGGPGGDAGNGGDITVIVKGGTTGTIIARSPPGQPGIGGMPGDPGTGGAPGFGGRGSAGCEGREGERRGPPGPLGSPASSGRAGSIGRNGSVRVDPTSLLQRE